MKIIVLFLYFRVFYKNFDIILKNFNCVVKLFLYNVIENKFDYFDI